MRYVALLSGGKDSCFNLLHCANNGHELVAAASLAPPQGKEELDSYLYQTVGQDAIELVAEALEVSLYRRFISGDAVEQGSEYGGREGGNSSGVKGDETEDLYELLSEVKARHPDIQGVSVGAILSNYQRVRVEHVCLRLSLTPLCYLWQRNQDELLSEMIDSGLEAVLIKVAGIGLKPKHLGQTLEAMRHILRNLNNLYGSHVCGEGGEYETLTLDSPLFKRRIVLKDVETVIHSDNDFATVAYLRIKDAALVDKDIALYTPISAPPLLDEEFEDLTRVLHNGHLNTETPASQAVVLDPKESHQVYAFKSGKWVVVGNVQRAQGASMTVDDQLKTCFEILRDKLSQYGLQISDLSFVNIFISDMSTFAEVNQKYKTFFGTSPPSRACVAVDLPPGVNARLDCIAYDDISNERRALHVQGLSYWAPANIGPYSQAVIVGDRIFVSGQIGMQPSHLALPSPPNFALETALAFQHVHRILNALRETYGAQWKERIQNLICWLVNISDLPKARKVSSVLKTYASVPTLFAGCKELPKGAAIEAQVIAHTGQYNAVEDEEVVVRQCNTALFDQGHIEDDSGTVHWEVSSFAEVSAFCAILAVRGDPLSAVTHIKEQLKEKTLWTETYSARLFHNFPRREYALHFVSGLFHSASQPAITEVPTRFIATRDAEDFDFALCLLGSSADPHNGISQP